LANAAGLTYRISRSGDDDGIEQQYKSCVVHARIFHSWTRPQRRTSLAN
jgi:hypothetical protein